MFVLAVAALLGSPGSPYAQDETHLDAIEAALDKYKDPCAAVHDLYLSTVGCIVYPEAGQGGEMMYPPGGMGVHFLNVPLSDGELDPMRPEVLIYERAEDGSLRVPPLASPRLAVEGKPGEGMLVPTLRHPVRISALRRGPSHPFLRGTAVTPQGGAG